MSELDGADWVDDLAEDFIDAKPIVDAPPVSTHAAHAPAPLSAPDLPEPVVEVMDVAYEVLDALTTP